MRQGWHSSGELREAAGEAERWEGLMSVGLRGTAGLRRRIASQLVSKVSQRGAAVERSVGHASPEQGDGG
jgi:hypothetical protein